MNRAFPLSLELARDLLAREAARGKSAGDDAGSQAARADQTARVCAKLREVLTAFAGTAGFHSLLARALTLAKAREPSLARVRVLEDGSLTGLEKAGGAADPGAKQTAGGQILVAQLLDLLVVFIGETLMQQLVRSAWPDMPASALRSRTKDTP